MADGVQPPPAQLQQQEALRGVLLICVGFLIVTFSDAAVKWALPEIGTALAMIWRGAFGALAAFLLAGRMGVWPVNRRLIAWRSLLQSSVTVIYYGVWLRGMPLADSYAITAVVPLMMTVLAIPMLGESVGWRRWLSTLVGFSGVLLMVRPGGALWTPDAAILLVGVLLMSVTRVWTRVLARTDRPATVAFWLLFAQVPIGVLLLPVFPPANVFAPWPMVLALTAMGAAHGAAHFLFARAFALAPVGLLAPFEYTTLVWGTVLGLLIWGDVPAWTTILGTAVVVLAGLYNLHRARVRARGPR